MTDRKRIVVLDDDRDVADIIQTVLLDEGFAVSCLYGPDDDTMEKAVLDLAPDCVIVGGSGPPRAPDPWTVARSLANHNPPIPTVLLSGSTTNLDEAMLGESRRAKASKFLAAVPKPFDVDRLVAVVTHAVGASRSPEHSKDAEKSETATVMAGLRGAGVQELRTSDTGREWITFRLKRHGDLFKLYRWPTAGMYFIGRYSPNGDRLQPLAELYGSQAAILYCTRLIQHERLVDA